MEASVYRDPQRVTALLNELKELVEGKSRSYRIMEVCGGQTHALLHYGLDQMLPLEIELLHGPGCPVCVTSSEILDLAFQMAQLPNVILATFSDMMRVPGSFSEDESLNFFKVRAKGGDVRMVQSPLEAVEIAQAHPDKEVVFFAIGFETTAPVNALSLQEALRLNLKNYSLLMSQVLVPPAIETLMSNAPGTIDGFLAAGHVCTVMGLEEYYPLASKYKIPIVATGFEPTDLLEGILFVVKQLNEGRFEVENQYSRVIDPGGNHKAQSLINEFFELGDQNWRGLGRVAHSGWLLREKYRDYDAEKKFFYLKESKINTTQPLCRSGEVLVGKIKPSQCEHFNKICKPEFPLGPTMVSSEGACAAYFKYRRGCD